MNYSKNSIKLTHQRLENMVVQAWDSLFVMEW